MNDLVADRLLAEIEASAILRARIAELEASLKMECERSDRALQHRDFAMAEADDNARRIAELEAAPGHERGLVAEFSKAAIASASEYRAAVLAEREACALLAEEYMTSKGVAAAIRARPAP